MGTTTFNTKKQGSISIFESETEYFIDILANAFHATKSRKEKAEIRAKYQKFVQAENEKRGFKCFNTSI